MQDGTGRTERPEYKPRLARKRGKATQNGPTTAAMLNRFESGAKRTPIERIRESAATERRWRLSLNPMLNNLEALRGMVEGTRRNYLSMRTAHAWELHEKALEALRAATPALPATTQWGRLELTHHRIG